MSLPKGTCFRLPDRAFASLPATSLQVLQQGIQSPELRFPELPIVFQPFAGVPQRPGFQAPWTPLRILAARNQSRPFEYFKVLGNRRLAHRKRLGQVRYRSLALRQPSQDSSARGIGQRREGGIKASGGFYITVRFHN